MADRGRRIMIAGLLAAALSAGAAGVAASAAAVAGGAHGTVVAPARNLLTPAQYYYRPRPARRVCWTQRQRVFAGYYRGRPTYRLVDRRVCGWRRY